MRKQESGMKTFNPQRIRTLGRIVFTVTATVLVAAFGLAVPQASAQDQIAPPSVPANLEAPADVKPFLVGHAYGTQNYSCLPSGRTVAWTLFGPQATLFDEDNEQIITHFLGPNPDEGGTLRASWQDSRDTSTVWGFAIQSSIDPAYVEPGAIPWLLLRVVGRQNGPTGGDRLSGATHIQRVNTSGGVAPATGCSGRTDIGKRVFVPYTTDYVFYK
jgi:hypothetical protein